MEISYDVHQSYDIHHMNLLFDAMLMSLLAPLHL